ncbi:uncharacterized protein LOC121754599 [Salvia splendens]|uniref:uncharacterized protein LOC121754599 n=1 Tax=Salvia splendens TaxID=180675 RepID=UPI001C2575B3|nr:uncharacterized protein LOC121754599 [Salvia splendens]
MVSYVPPHQRGYQNQNSNAPSQQQGSQGPQGNFHHGSGSSSDNPPGATSGQPTAKQPKGTEKLIGDLLNSQQHIQGNMQANNDVVHKLQDALLEHKAALDMLTKQISQMATTLNEIRRHNSHLLATVKMPDKANISKITLRSKKDYAEPLGGTDEGKKGPLPHFSDPVLPDEEPEELHEEKRRQKEDPADFMEIFGKPKINLSFLQALKLPPFSRFIKDFIAGKAKADGKIVIRESMSTVIQKKRLPSKRTDPGMFTLPIIIGDVNIEHAMAT